MVSPLAGTLTKERIDTEKLRKLFWEPDGEAAPVKFGTSGHRGALGRGFCAAHARAIAQAVARSAGGQRTACDFARYAASHTGVLF